jgi:hypothetical protein
MKIAAEPTAHQETSHKHHHVENGVSGGAVSGMSKGRHARVTPNAKGQRQEPAADDVRFVL